MALPGLFAIFLLGTYSVANMLSDHWSFVRLSPSVAMLRGYALYYPEGEGPLLGWSYGPIMPLLQLPAAALPHPVAAMVAAGILNEIMLLFPLLLLFWKVVPDTFPNRMAGVLVLAALHAFMMYSRASLYWIRQIQVDTFAMGLALLGLAALLQADPTRPVPHWRLWMSAALFCAAIFSKQNELFFAPVPLLYLWVREGRAKARQLAFAILVTGSLGALGCVAAFGWNAVVLNMGLIPARHPWTAHGPVGIAWVGLELVEQASGLIVLFGCLVLLDLRFGPRASTLRGWVIVRPWLFPAAGALLILPISLLGKVKVGGDDNSYHSIYYLAAAVGMMTASLMPVENRFSLGMRILCSALALSGTLFYFFHEMGALPLETQLRNSRLGAEYRFALEHPEEAYFASDPLVTLYSDKKLYHQGYGVYDRVLANFPPSARQLREHLPAKLRWVMTPGSPWWVPDDLAPIPAPQGLGGAYWLEKKSAP